MYTSTNHYYSSSPNTYVSPYAKRKQPIKKNTPTAISTTTKTTKKAEISTSSKEFITPLFPTVQTTPLKPITVNKDHTRSVRTTHHHHTSSICGNDSALSIHAAWSPPPRCQDVDRAPSSSYIHTAKRYLRGPRKFVTSALSISSSDSSSTSQQQTELYHNDSSIETNDAPSRESGVAYHCHPHPSRKVRRRRPYTKGMSYNTVTATNKRAAAVVRRHEEEKKVLKKKEMMGANRDENKEACGEKEEEEVKSECYYDHCYTYSPSPPPAKEQSLHGEKNEVLVLTLGVPPTAAATATDGSPPPAATSTNSIENKAEQKLDRCGAPHPNKDDVKALQQRLRLFDQSYNSHHGNCNKTADGRSTTPLLDAFVTKLEVDKEERRAEDHKRTHTSTSMTPSPCALVGDDALAQAAEHLEWLARTAAPLSAARSEETQTHEHAGGWEAASTTRYASEVSALAHNHEDDIASLESGGSYSCTSSSRSGGSSSSDSTDDSYSMWRGRTQDDMEAALLQFYLKDAFKKLYNTTSFGHAHPHHKHNNKNNNNNNDSATRNNTHATSATGSPNQSRQSSDGVLTASVFSTTLSLITSEKAFPFCCQTDTASTLSSSSSIATILRTTVPPAFPNPTTSTPLLPLASSSAAATATATVAPPAEGETLLLLASELDQREQDRHAEEMRRAVTAAASGPLAPRLIGYLHEHEPLLQCVRTASRFMLFALMKCLPHDLFSGDIDKDEAKEKEKEKNANNETDAISGLSYRRVLEREDAYVLDIVSLLVGRGPNAADRKESPLDTSAYLSYANSYTTNKDKKIGRNLPPQPQQQRERAQASQEATVTVTIAEETEEKERGSGHSPLSPIPLPPSSFFSSSTTQHTPAAAAPPSSPSSSKYRFREANAALKELKRQQCSIRQSRLALHIQSNNASAGAAGSKDQTASHPHKKKYYFSSPEEKEVETEENLFEEEGETKETEKAFSTLYRRHYFASLDHNTSSSSSRGKEAKRASQRYEALMYVLTQLLSLSRRSSVWLAMRQLWPLLRPPPPPPSASPTADGAATRDPAHSDNYDSSPSILAEVLSLMERAVKDGGHLDVDALTRLDTLLGLCYMHLQPREGLLAKDSYFFLLYCLLPTALLPAQGVRVRATEIDDATDPKISRNKSRRNLRMSRHNTASSLRHVKDNARSFRYNVNSSFRYTTTASEYSRGVERPTALHPYLTELFGGYGAAPFSVAWYNYLLEHYEVVELVLAALTQGETEVEEEEEEEGETEEGTGDSGAGSNNGSASGRKKSAYKPKKKTLREDRAREVAESFLRVLCTRDADGTSGNDSLFASSPSSPPRATAGGEGRHGRATDPATHVLVRVLQRLLVPPPELLPLAALQVFIRDQATAQKGVPHKVDHSAGVARYHHTVGMLRLGPVTYMLLKELSEDFAALRFSFSEKMHPHMERPPSSRRGVAPPQNKKSSSNDGSTSRSAFFSAFHQESLLQWSALTVCEAATGHALSFVLPPLRCHFADVRRQWRRQRRQNDDEGAAAAAAAAAAATKTGDTSALLGAHTDRVNFGSYAAASLLPEDVVYRFLTEREQLCRDIFANAPFCTHTQVALSSINMCKRLVLETVVLLKSELYYLISGMDMRDPALATHHRVLAEMREEEAAEEERVRRERVRQQQQRQHQWLQQQQQQQLLRTSIPSVPVLGAGGARLSITGASLPMPPPPLTPASNSLHVSMATIPPLEAAAVCASLGYLEANWRASLLPPGAPTPTLDGPYAHPLQAVATAAAAAAAAPSPYRTSAPPARPRAPPPTSMASILAEMEKMREQRLQSNKTNPLLNGNAFIEVDSLSQGRPPTSAKADEDTSSHLACCTTTAADPRMGSTTSTVPLARHASLAAVVSGMAAVGAPPPAAKGRPKPFTVYVGGDYSPSPPPDAPTAPVPPSRPQQPTRRAGDAVPTVTISTPSTAATADAHPWYMAGRSEQHHARQQQRPPSTRAQPYCWLNVNAVAPLVAFYIASERSSWGGPAAPAAGTKGPRAVSDGVNPYRLPPAEVLAVAAARRKALTRPATAEGGRHARPTPRAGRQRSGSGAPARPYSAASARSHVSTTSSSVFTPVAVRQTTERVALRERQQGLEAHWVPWTL